MNIMSNKFPICRKWKVFLLYESETLALRNKIIQELKTAQRIVNIVLLNITGIDRRGIKCIMDLTKICKSEMVRSEEQTTDGQRTGGKKTKRCSRLQKKPK